MRLITLGINHATAPLALRERVAIPSEQLAATLAALSADFAPDLRHAVVLSTCNRTELYAAIDRPLDALPAVRDALARWFAVRHDAPAEQLAPHWYWHVDDAALRHACRVACGARLDGDRRAADPRTDEGRGTPVGRARRARHAAATGVRPLVRGREGRPLDDGDRRRERVDGRGRRASVASASSTGCRRSTCCSSAPAR